MYKFLPFMTNDYSIGLFDSDVNDIYHSAFGAISEAFYKFVYPVSEILSDSNKINVLDICYGIGYNTKALISETLSKDIVFNIDCVDINKELIYLSPFIKTKVSLFDRIFNKNKLYTNISNYKEANKIIKLKNNSNSNLNIPNEVNLILLKNIIDNFGTDFLESDLKNIITETKNSPFFDKNVMGLFDYLAKKDIYLHQNKNKTAFVHNIYYEYISKRYKLYKKYAFNNKFNVKFHPTDVRSFIQNTQNKYDIIFLDGFTPAKCPCIWSYEFIKELYEHLSNNGSLVTYNTSAIVHNTLCNAGFLVGNIIENNKVIGTIASNNINNIKHNLSDAQKGLLKTKAGIMYHDCNLSLDNDTIYSNRQIEFENSNLMSSSKYLKGLKNEI